MKTQLAFGAVLAALTTLVSGNTCKGTECGDCGMFINSWKIEHDGGVEFSQPFCKGFWDNLGCIAPSVRACGNNAENGKGFITFNAGSACNRGDIQRAWWDATKNEFGAIFCEYEAA